MKKLAIVLFLFVLLCYFVAAISFLNRANKALVCSGVEIVMEDSARGRFISEADVLQMLDEGKCNPVGLLIDSVELGRIKDELQECPWIEKIVVYKTPGGKVCIHLNQRRPILRVMPDGGKDYYIDREGKIIPRSAFVAELAVATGKITKEYACGELAVLGRFIQDDAFWNDQIEQINVLADGEVELVPRVGGHVILLGAAADVENKLNRMKEFYVKGLKKTGWTKYSQISLKYDGQIICKRNKK